MANKAFIIAAAITLLCASYVSATGEIHPKGTAPDGKRTVRTGWHSATETNLKKDPPQRVESSEGGSGWLGLALGALGLFIVFYNEKRAMNRSKALSEALMNTQEIATTDAGTIHHPEFEGKLVRLYGRAQPVGSEAQVADKAFGVSLPALKLKRTVEIFQWIEERKSTSEKVRLFSSHPLVAILTLPITGCRRNFGKDRFHLSLRLAREFE